MINKNILQKKIAINFQYTLLLNDNIRSNQILGIVKFTFPIRIYNISFSLLTKDLVERSMAPYYKAMVSAIKIMSNPPGK